MDIGGIVRIFTCKQVKAMQWMGGNSEIIVAMLEHSTTVGNYPAVMTCYLSISYYITLNTRDHKYLVLTPSTHDAYMTLNYIL